MSNTNGSSPQSILDAYHRRDFSALAQMDLGTPIDSDGNTIVHVMAASLDKPGFQELKKINPNALSDSVVNKQNKKDNDLPIHSALRTVYTNNSAGHAFITYMIEELGAKQNIPNKDNWVISQTPGGKNIRALPSPSVVNKSVQVDRINDGMKTIQELMNNVNGSDKSKSTGCSSSGMSSSTGTSRANDVSTLNFIRMITEHYVSHQQGGYSGKRTIKGVLSDFDYSSIEDDGNDSFSNIRQRTKLMNDFESLMNQDRVKLDPKATEAYNAILQKIMELLGVDEETARTYRSALKITLTRKNPELKKRENDAIKIKEIEKIFEDDKKAKKMLADIDIEEIKAYMNEQREKAIANAQTKRTYNGSQNETSSEEPKPKKTKPVTTSSFDTSEEPKKAPKSKTATTKTKKVAENGYLMSDEIIFSPHY